MVRALPRVPICVGIQCSTLGGWRIVHLLHVALHISLTPTTKLGKLKFSMNAAQVQEQS